MNEAGRLQVIKDTVAKDTEKLTRMDIFDMVRKRK